MDWKVGKAAQICSGCGASLEKTEFYSALRDNGIDFDRWDYCPSCWEETRQEDLFSHWRTRLVPDGRAKKRRRYVDVDTLLGIFQKLAGRPGEKEVFTFLLGMVLVQKRVLRYDRSDTRDGQEYVTLVLGRSGDTFEVTHPVVSEEEMVRAQESFATLLQIEEEGG